PQPPLPQTGAMPVHQAKRPVAGNGIKCSLPRSPTKHTRLPILCEAFILCQILSGDSSKRRMSASLQGRPASSHLHAATGADKKSKALNNWKLFLTGAVEQIVAVVP